MGMFDDLVNSAKGQIYQAVEGEAQGLIAQAVQQVTPGGVGGLLSKLQAGGLGEQVTSWLSEGHNLPVSEEQLQGVLGDEHIQQMASALGLDPSKLLQGLAEHLPAIANQTAEPG